MISFEQISIDRISTRDFLVILQALDYTYEHTKMDDFARLKEVLLKELCSLTETNSQEELLELLKANLS